jgi:acyl-CoA thioesterase
MPVPPAGEFAALVGLEPTAIDDGRCVFEVTVEPRHMNPYGVVHGGLLYSLVDTAMGAALLTRLDQHERCATLEIKINYLAPAVRGRLSCVATLVERTRRIGVLEARVSDGEARLLAVATGSFYITAGSP